MQKVMKGIFLFFLLGSVVPVNAQLTDVVRDLFQVSTDTMPIATSLAADTDSIRFVEITRQLEAAKANEIALRMEIEQIRVESLSSDSIKKAHQKQRIDSLRAVTRGVPVVISGDTIFEVYAKQGGVTPFDRVKEITQKINSLGREFAMIPDSVHVESSELVTDIMYKDKVLVTLNDLDGLWENTTRDELAERYRTVIVDKLSELKAEYGLMQLLKRIFFFIVVLVIQFILYRLTKYLYIKLRNKVIQLKNTKLKPISFNNYEVLDTNRQVRLLLLLLKLGKYALLIIQLLISVPILFSIFPQTENVAKQIFSYLWIPVRSILWGIINYIPNLFTIIVICVAIRYIVKGIKYLANEIASERLKIAGFYPDWAQPTFQIVRFLLYAFMIAMIYPHLPGAESGVFQGISVFVGLIVSLGSSTVIGNIIAGMVMTYMRAFHIGDRIKLNDITGNVVEKTPLVTRVKTPKNELVTIPNSFIMSSHTVNYSSSARELGLIIHTDVTVGYEIPWRKVHQLLIEAAKRTEGVVAHPEPFVLETFLHDYYPIYQINAYIKDADRLAQIYSNLYQSIQDIFAEADIELLSPHYIATRDGNEITIPTGKYRKAKDTAGEVFPGTGKEV